MGRIWIIGKAGPGEVWASTTEGYDHRCASGGGDVHGTGVIGKHGIAGGEGGNQLGKGGAAGEIGVMITRQGISNFRGDVLVSGAPKQEHVGSALLDQLGSGLDKILGGPTLGWAVFGSGNQANVRSSG